MEALRAAYGHLEAAEGRISRDLADLEAETLEHLRRTRKSFAESALKHVDLRPNENFVKIEAFGNKLKTVADESDAAIGGLKRALEVVETVSILYHTATKTLECLAGEGAEDAFEQIGRYVSAVEAARARGHWPDVELAAAGGHIGQTVAALRAAALQTLRANVATEHSKLLTRLAVALGAEREAFEAYMDSLRLEAEPKGSAKLIEAPGDEVTCLSRLIQNARGLLVRQANAVFAELGAHFYLELVREIHKNAAAEAAAIFRDLVRLNFGHLLGPEGAEGAGGDVVAELERLLKTPAVVEDIAADPKHQKLLDVIATLASMWNDFEAALREATRPVYAGLPEHDGRFAPDGLVFLSAATKTLQSILAVYVQLQHAFTLRAVVQAIEVGDTVYISREDNAPTSTLVDDVFFILQKSQHRSIGTGDIQTACATFNQVAGIIANELKAALMDNLVQSQPIYERWTQVGGAHAQRLENLSDGSLFNMLEEHFRRTRGSTPELIGGPRSRAGSRHSFVHSLNNIEECLGLLAKFKLEMTECFGDEFLKGTRRARADNQEKTLLVYNTIQALDLVRAELEQILETCCSYALNMFKVRPDHAQDHLTEPLNRFAATDFEMDEDRYAQAQVGSAHAQNEDSFGDALVAVLRTVLGHIQAYYSPNVGLRCTLTLLEKVCKYLEAAAAAKRYTVYGAVYFDTAVRTLAYACSGHSQEVRNQVGRAHAQFTALLQISDVLNANSASDLALLRESETAIDVAKYSALRVDLPSY